MRRRAVAASGGEEPISMKMLGSLALASRQKLSLIQVGDEKILIGVGPDSVTFIANVGRGEGRVQRLTEATLAKAIPQAQPRLAAFESVLAREAAAPLEQAPKLKKIPGNDEASLRDEPEAAPPVKKPEPAPRREAPKRPAPSRVNVAVGEDGVQDLRTANATAGARPKDDSAKPASRESVDDVTKLIREKLRQLKTI
jgi:flagellar biogenesis protein FliO